MAVRAKKARVSRRAKAPAKPKKAGYECSICGYRLVVDKACGCEEEHVIYCCSQPMKKT